MSTFSRRRMTIAGLTGVSLAAAGFLAPGALAANTIDGDVSVSNTETVQVLMDASGKIDAQRIYEQVVLRGTGKVDLANPVSTDGLRNLDGFGGFDVRDGNARIKTDVDGTKKFRSVSNFTKDLPLKVEATYLLDGKEIEPSDVVGQSGRLQVKYRVTNQTGTEQEVSYVDGNGEKQTSMENVVVPMVGSMTTTLPSTFTNIETEGSNSAGDGRGGTQLSFTMTLFPPIGDAVAEVGYAADVKDAIIPKASLSALPVNALENNSFKGGAASYQGGAESGQDLTAGATEIDANLLKIRDGAVDLVDGLLQLQEGANKLSAGLQNDAAPGAGKLAAGADELNAGAKKLKGGTSDLAEGSKKLDSGARDLKNGVGELSSGVNGDDSDENPGLQKGIAQLKDGAALVDNGLQTLNGTVSAGGGQFKQTFADGVDTTMAQVAQLLSAGVANALKTNLSEGAIKNLGLPADVEAQVVGAITAVGQGIGRTITDTLTGQVGPGLKQKVNGGLDQLTGGVSAAIGSPGSTFVNPATGKEGPSLRNGVGQITGGLDRLAASGTKLIEGIEKLSAGTSQLKAGTGDLRLGAGQLNSGAGQLSAGTGQLSTGAGTLAAGLNTAAAGSGQLSAGLDQAAESAPALPEGASKLSKEGTKKLVSTGNQTAMDYGLKYALIENSSKRGASAQPYGSPEGATALTAYKFEIAGEDGAGSANMKRGLAALALLAGAGAFAAVRRRGLI